MNHILLFQDEINDLIVLLDEVTRANPNGDRFIEPYSGVLKLTNSKRNHLIFGRRGSGKSSLIQKSRKSIDDKAISVYIDIETLNENKYPDVLIIVIIKILNQILEYYRTHRPWVLRVGWDKIKLFSGNGRLIDNVTNTISSFDILLHSEDSAQLEQKIKKTKISNSSLNFEVSHKTVGKAGGGSAESNSHEQEFSESFRRSKIDILNRNVASIAELIRRITSTFETSIYIYIDDLYHIPMEFQPELLGFIQKISKNNDTWLKIGTIKYRSNWYKYTDRPIGLKIGDDASEIDLDMTLEHYSTTKDFLVTLAQQLTSEVKAPDFKKIVNENAVDRLILASGGVSRDFINLFRISILNAQERLRRNIDDSNGKRVAAEDVNNASGAYGESKFEEFRKDSHENSDELRKYFEGIRHFCINIANANCFLVDLDHKNKKIDELIDLKLFHRISPRVTVSKRQGMVYQALMLDLSQYAGTRTIRNLQVIDFWKKENIDSLRRVGLILPADIMNGE